MNSSTTNCECCEKEIHHITLPNHMISFDGEDFELHLDEDDLTDFYLTLKAIQCA